MTDTLFDMIRAEITRAKRYADAGQMRLAAHAFALMRTLIVEQADPTMARQVAAAQRVPLRAAREAFRAALAGRSGEGRPLLILTDGAVQPASAQGARTSYAWRLGDAPHARRVDCVGQHLYTSADILTLLTNAPRLGAGADVVLHIGHHDSAQPLFNQMEQVAVSLLPANVAAQVAEFAAIYSLALAEGLPARHEVTVDRFRAHLTGILRALRTRGVRRVVMVTLPLQTTTTAYNATLLQVARQADVTVLDFDRLSRHLPELPLHWPDALHAQMADHLAALLHDDAVVQA
jgi:hypothetical protein